MSKHLQSASLASTREMSWDEHLCIVLQGKGTGNSLTFLILHLKFRSMIIMVMSDFKFQVQLLVFDFKL